MSYSLNALLQTRVVGGWVVGSHVDPLVGKFGANQGEEDTSTLLLCSTLASSNHTQVNTSTRVPLTEEQLVQIVSLVAALGGSDTVVVHWLSTTPPADQVVPN